MTEETRVPFDEWAILELMGHRRLAGKVTEQEIAGTSFIRIDVPGPDSTAVTQFYSPSAVYAITPTTQEVATAVARANLPQPVTPWELSRLLPTPDLRYSAAGQDDEGEDDEPGDPDEDGGDDF